MSEEVEVVPPTPEKKEFHVEIRKTSYGYVRVNAYNKEHAEKTIQQMNRQKMLSYYKDKFEFVDIGEASDPNNIDETNSD